MISDIFFSEVNSEKVSSLRMYFFIFSISLSILTFFILKKTWISSRYANPLLFSGGFLSELETNYNESNKTKMKKTIISISFILLICICFWWTKHHTQDYEQFLLLILSKSSLEVVAGYKTSLLWHDTSNSCWETN